MVERKSGYAVVIKVNLQTFDGANVATAKRIKVLAAQVRKIVYVKGEKFADHGD